MINIVKKQFNIKMFIFLSFSILMFIFLSSTNVLADDDNANKWQCREATADCDNNSNTCDYYSFNWATNGYPGTSGNASCCGDDSEENNYITSDCNGNSVSFCCPSSLPYVQNGTCVNQCGCGDNALAGSEGDLVQATCESFGYKWSLTIGNSTSGCWSYDDDPYRCCGDDSNEYHLSCSVQANSGATCDTVKNESCCDTASSCVYGGSCYNLNQHIDTADSSIDLEVCENYNGTITWEDLDLGHDATSQPGTTRCVVDGYHWFTDDNACDNAGPNGTCKDSDITDRPFCCGDDPNENYVATDCDSNSVSLCCPDDKPYVKNGSCVDSCGCGDNSYDGTDYDDSQSHCDSVSAFHYDATSCNSSATAWSLSNGNSSSSCWQNKCCGDDTGEYNITYNAYYQTTCDTNQLSACCDTSTDCWDVGTGDCINTHGASIGLSMACEDNVWQDCDDYYSDCGSAICGSASGVYGGESGFGGYTDTTTLECCGDDSGENYVATDCDSNSVSLCCPDDKPYVKNGSCVDTCGCGDNALAGSEGDLAESNCGSYGWNLTGGNSPSNCWQSGQDDPYLCCGDDSDEYYIGECDPPNATCGATKHCCAHNNDCSLTHGADTCTSYGDTDNYFGMWDFICHGGSHWDDCDDYYNECGANICGSSSGVYAGETGGFSAPNNFSTYSDTTTLECCGDDSDEYYANLASGVTGDRKCCNSSDDLVASDGGCDTPPTISLSSPTDTATCQTQSGVELSWSASDGDNGPNPLSYHIYLSSNQSLVTNHDASVLVATVSSNSYTTNTLNYNTIYYWTVLADDSALQTASSVYSFTTQVCDSSQGCCQTDGCDYIGAGGQPHNQVDGYSCNGDSGCGGSCDITGDDYYCKANDATVYLNSGATGVTCDSCESWDNSDGCDISACGSECSGNTPCSTSHCSDPFDPDGSGDAGEQIYYQTRLDTCNNCNCLAWGSYESCQDSYNNCTGANRVECYQGSGCNTNNNACYCEDGYNPDGAGGCASDGTYPVVDFDWCLSTGNTVQFMSSVSGGSGVYSTYAWDFDDSSCPTGNDCDDTDPLHDYSTTASYDVSLTVTDSTSGQGSHTETVDLNASGKDCATPFNFNSIASQSSSQLSLEWDYSLGNDSYTIYRDGSAISNPNYSCNINTCTYTDTSLNPGTQYTYYIVATNSNTYNSTTNPSCTGGQGGPPTCPLSAYTKSDVGSLSFTTSCGQIIIQWPDLGSAYTYHLYKDFDRNGDNNCNDEIGVEDLVSDISRDNCNGTICTYTDKDVIPEKEYYYRVTSESVDTGVSSLNDASESSSHSYCYRSSVWGEI